MCGIAGVFSYAERVDPAQPALVRAMCDALVHRGPDDHGFYDSGPVSMGMRRLSVVDIRGGHQPISNEQGTVWLVYNGEIYNFADLRKELMAQGHVFRTRTDSEVVVHAYEEWGTDCLLRFRGMFAFSLWDVRRQQLFVARDQLGIKPLYFRDTGTRIVWASEVKALLEDANVAREPDPATFHSYLRFRFVPAPQTFLRGVKKLMPGHYFTCTPGSAPRPVRYWRLPSRAETSLRRSTKSWTSELRARLTDSVERQLVADVPLGAFLSGGIDSSAITALMARASSRPIKTFSVSFNDASNSEMPHARRVANHLGAEHHEIVVEPASFDLLSTIAWHLDEPVADPAAIPTFLLSRFARQHVTVVLTGEGADELFAGYSKYRWNRLVALVRRLPLPLRRLALSSLAQMPGTSARTARIFTSWVEAPIASRIVNMMSDLDQYETDALLHSDVVSSRLSENDAPSEADELAAMLRADTEVTLPDDLLLKVDRMTMASSLEARVPFLDHTLVEFSASMPASLKIRWGVEKWALRSAVADLLPRPIAQRRKQVFEVPLDRWFAGDLRGYVMDLLGDVRTKTRGYWNRVAVDRLADRFWKGEAAFSQSLFTIVLLELWSREYLDRGPRGAALPAEVMSA